jgi:hypothetical protein
VVRISTLSILPVHRIVIMPLRTLRLRLPGTAGSLQAWERFYELGHGEVRGEGRRSLAHGMGSGGQARASDKGAGGRSLLLLDRRVKGDSKVTENLEWRGRR